MEPLFDWLDVERDQILDGDSLGSLPICRHVLLRLVGNTTLVELVCLRRHHHRDGHVHALVARTRPSDNVAVAGGVS